MLYFTKTKTSRKFVSSFMLSHVKCHELFPGFHMVSGSEFHSGFLGSCVNIR